MQNRKLQVLQSEVKEFYKKIKEALSPDEPFNEDYLGYKIFYGQFVENPKILFIGFNPGVGKRNADSINIELTEPAETSEYYNESYQLVNNAKKVLEAIGKSHWIYEDDAQGCEYVTKINLYYLISKDIPIFYQLLSKLSQTSRDEFYFNSHKWTTEIIKLIKPQYIYCEGIEVFRKINELYKAEIVPTLIRGIEMSFIKTTNTKVFGIVRNRSNYDYRPGVIELLQKEMI